MEYPNFVIRDFSELGEIQITILPDNKLHVMIRELHVNFNGYKHGKQGPDGPGCQADLVVKYQDNFDLFTVITTVLDKLTDDHRYYLAEYLSYDCKISDCIHCFSEFVKDNPDLSYIEYGVQQSSNAGWASLEFSQENMKYVGVHSGYKEFEDCITLYGEVNTNGIFSYDYPIISRDMDQKYYDITRGHNVRRITLDPETYEYIIDPEFNK
jgi:hypothetical protein